MAPTRHSSGTSVSLGESWNRGTEAPSVSGPQPVNRRVTRSQHLIVDRAAETMPKESRRKPRASRARDRVTRKRRTLRKTKARRVMVADEEEDPGKPRLFFQTWTARLRFFDVSPSCLLSSLSRPMSCWPARWLPRHNNPVVDENAVNSEIPQVWAWGEAAFLPSDVQGRLLENDIRYL